MNGGWRRRGGEDQLWSHLLTSPHDDGDGDDADAGDDADDDDDDDDIDDNYDRSLVLDIIGYWWITMDIVVC